MKIQICTYINHRQFLFVVIDDAISQDPFHCTKFDDLQKVQSGYNVQSCIFASIAQGHLKRKINKKSNQIRSDRAAMLKFLYSEKATKFCEIFPLLLTTVTVYSLFAIIQSKFRLIKGQQYLKNMYEINCDD